jgi:hypothetical protein
MPETFADLPILAELRADLDAAFARAEAGSPAAAWRRRRALVPAGGLIAVAVAAAAAIALTSGADSGRLAPTPATAAEALHDVASVAAATDAPVPRDDQYFYVRSDATWESDAISSGTQTITLEHHVRQIWLSVDRPGRLVDRIDSVRPLTATGLGPATVPGAAVAGGAMAMAPIHHYFIGDERLSRAGLLAFPTDPATIYERLSSRVGDRGNSNAGEVFTEIGDALRESPAPPALRAGLYGALALVPGIELVGPTNDAVGRPGLAVALTESGTRRELLFDPKTSELLAEREVLVDPAAAHIDAPAGTVTSYAVYLTRAVTDTPTP